MSVLLRDLVAFFTEFERAISSEAAPGVMESYPRNIRGLLDLFTGYANCKFEVLQLDFSEGMPAATEKAHQFVGRPQNLASLIANFGERAEIYINSMRGDDGEYLLNLCHRRFLIMKEAFHVIIREEFKKNNLVHPDGNTAEAIQASIENIIYLPFSINDLVEDNPFYSDVERIENAAELFALWTMYPLDDIARDRKEFLQSHGVVSYNDAAIQVSSTFDYANKFKVPQRYVDVMFRWDGFSDLYDIYLERRNDTGIGQYNPNDIHHIVGSRNQTKLAWIRSRQNRNDLGIGICVAGNAQNPRFSYITSVGYENFIKVALGFSNLIAYQWVPAIVATEEMVRNPNCGALQCSISTGCVMPGCICVDGVCRRPSPK